MFIIGEGDRFQVDLDWVLVIIEMLEFGAAPDYVFGVAMFLIGDDIVDELIHAIFTLELVSPYAVKTLGIGFDAEHSFFEEHWNILYLLKSIILLYLDDEFYKKR